MRQGSGIVPHEPNAILARHLRDGAAKQMHHRLGATAPKASGVAEGYADTDPETDRDGATSAKTNARLQKNMQR